MTGGCELIKLTKDRLARENNPTKFIHMDIEQTKEECLTNPLKFGAYLSPLEEERKGKEKASGKKKMVTSGKIKGFLEE